MRSRWADLAEFRESDFEYEPGTLVMFGGDKEITLSDGRHVHAIVTTKPGLVLNGGSDSEKDSTKIMIGIALTGTVPVKIAGKVKKFDRLVASRECAGCARRRRWYEFWRRPIGIALEDSEPFCETVKCVTRMEF